MPDLSIVIPARNERWLSRTVADILEHIEADTEVIAVLDGAWSDPGIPQHERVTVVYLPEPIGQRAATNLGMRQSHATYVMKLDAHCGVAPGFDRALIESAKELGPDVTQIPAQWNLHIYDYICNACGRRDDQAPVMPSCPACNSTDRRIEVVWKTRRKTTNWYLDKDLRFCYGSDKKQVGDICDVMTSLGACFFMSRERFWQLDGLDEGHGSWGQFGAEIGLKSWLSGGRHVVNRRTWFSHFFRVGGIGFPYEISGTDQEHARFYSRDLWLNDRWPKQTRPLAWLIEKFAPAPGWHDVDPGAVVRINESADAFRIRLSAPSAMANHASAMAIDGWRQDVSDMAVSAAGPQSGQPVASQDVIPMVHKSEVGGIAAVSAIADVVNNRDADAIAIRDRFDKPCIHEAMSDVSLLRDAQASVAVTDCAVPQPTISDSVAANFREEATKPVSIEEWNGEILLGSHASVSSGVGLGPRAVRQHSRGSSSIISKGIIYYSDSCGDPVILQSCRDRLQLSASTLPIASVTLHDFVDWTYPFVVGSSQNRLMLERGYLAMFKQILAGLEALDTEYVFFAEHDCMYDPSHFSFTPPRNDVYYYNLSWWKIDAKTGRAVTYVSKQTSQLCANRELLVQHYRTRVSRVEREGFTRAMGFEPGSHGRKERIDDVPSDVWRSAGVNYDIRHAHNLTPSRWSRDQFRSQRNCEGWRESHVDIEEILGVQQAIA